MKSKTIKFRIAMIVIAIVFLIINFFGVDFSNLAWEDNRGMYLRMIALLVLIVGMVYANRLESKKGGGSHA